MWGHDKSSRGKEFREIEVLYENGNKAIVTGVKDGRE